VKFCLQAMFSVSFVSSELSSCLQLLRRVPNHMSADVLIPKLRV